MAIFLDFFVPVSLELCGTANCGAPPLNAFLHKSDGAEPGLSIPAMQTIQTRVKRRLKRCQRNGVKCKRTDHQNHSNVAHGC